MKEPVRILSDLHLGHAASLIDDVNRLRPLLEGAGTVIFNGDTWQELSRAYRPKAEVLLKDLQSLCSGLGVETIFLSGNHDPGWDGKGWEELADGRIVITHGDAVLWSGSPWSREALTQQEEIRQLWEQHQKAEKDAGERLLLAREMARMLQAAYHPRGKTIFDRALDAVRPPQRAAMILNVWLRHAAESASFADRYFPEAEFLIVGHFHRPGVWRFGRKVVINTGAFVNPHHARWVEWGCGWLRTGTVTPGESWTLGDVTDVWRLP